ncbi:MAG: hypothetical protein KAU36_05620 [candidate division Zixibacteria bacterium]|nr:hypothetical protein [candidate division Zixibacteria bacterium]
MIVSAKLLLWCLLASGLWLLASSLLIEFLGKRFGFYRGIPKEVAEDSGPAWFLLHYIIEFIFLVVLPTLGYSFFYVVLPFYTIKAGMAAALFAFTLGAAPVMIGLSVRVKLPMPYLLYLLLGYLVKLTGSLVIIAYLYTM